MTNFTLIPKPIGSAEGFAEVGDFLRFELRKDDVEGTGVD